MHWCVRCPLVRLCPIQDPGHRILQILVVPPEGLTGPVFEARTRPHLSTAADAPVPLALMVLDPTQFPSLSSARRALRRGGILLLRAGSRPGDGEGNKAGSGPAGQGAGAWQGAVTAGTADRVCPGDRLAKQVPSPSGKVENV